MTKLSRPNNALPARAWSLLQRHRRGAQIERFAQRVAELERRAAVGQALSATRFTGRLDTLLAVSSALLVTHDIPTILRLVVDQAVQLFPGASGALLFLAGGERTIVLRAASGAQPRPIDVEAGHSAEGRAFLAPRAMLLVGPELELALDELEAPQLAELQRLLTPWPPASALLAPLRIESRRLGSLVVYGGADAHLFIPRDLPFVQALADLAAVAIAETGERERAQQLQRTLSQAQSSHAETQARLDTAQAQLLQSAKLAAVGELAASVAHEINNPLYAARNSLFLIEQDLPAESDVRPFLEIAQGELARIARIITRMRDFYRPTRAELEPICLNELLRGTIELVQTHLRHGQVEVRSQLADQLPKIVAHADQLRQVFLNLILNACDAMPSGGTLTVSTQALPPGAPQASEVTVRIADSGEGITAEHLSHLFEPFYTTKPQGTGLGLAISAHIVTQHGGRIEVESTAGSGTCFTISLPTEPAASLAPDVSGSPE